MPYKQLGKLQAGTPDCTEFAFYSFRGGLNIKGAPQLIGDEDLSIAYDGYLRPDGAFQLRNGMATYGTAIANYPLYLARFYQTVQNGAAVSPVTKLLGVCNGILYNITSGSGNSTIGTVNGTQATFARFQDPNDPNFASGLTDVTIICSGSGGPYVYDGTNFYTPAGWSQATGAQWCSVVNGIVWFGGIPTLPNQIFGTGDGITASFESLPGYRNFVLSSYVTGLCAQGSGATAALIIGRNTGVSVLYGTGPSTFFLQDLPFQDGIVAGRSMVSANGVVYFLGHMAYYSFDTQTIPQQISQKVEPWILNDPFTPGYPMNGYNQFSWAQVYNNRLHLGYASSSTSPNVILCYDLVMQGWTCLRPTPGLTSMVLLDAPNDPDPYVALVGSSTTGQAYTWDYVAGSTQTILDGAAPVLAQVQSKYFKLGVPGTNKALERFYPEFQNAGAFQTNFTVSTDYGAQNTQTETTNPAPVQRILTWDAGPLYGWDNSVWGGPTQYIPFGSPTSRLDLPGIQGESFAFGVSMTTALASWIWAGGTGVFSQQGRT